MLDTIQGHSIFVDPLAAAPPVILDLGANHGAFSKMMHQRFGGNYFLVEANPSLAQALQDEKQFHVWSCAVTPHDGTVEFNVAPSDVWSTVMEASPQKGTGTMTCQKIVVPARSLGSLLAEVPFPRIDLLKMDIEGIESKILLGLTPQVLQKIGQITVEFHCAEMFGFNNRDEVMKSIRHLRQHGFLCLNFSGETLMDVLFINRRLHRIPILKGWLWELSAESPPWFKGIKRLIPRNLHSLVHQTIDWFSPPK